MQVLRNLDRVTRLVLVGFALSLGVAIASPLVKAQPLQLICSASGLLKLAIQGDDGANSASLHSLDCALCATGHAPPPAHRLRIELTPQAPQALQRLATASNAAFNAAPLQARAPPISALI